MTDSDSRVLPMFPLGAVLLPGMAMPLHVFEPRYRALVQDCLAGEPEFGVVLIERGSEVGGGDQRFAVGTLARITEVAAAPDGRYALTVLGIRRVRCVEWLPDSPYPRARVEFPADDVDGDGAHAAALATIRAEVEASLRRLLALHAELGEPVPALDLALPDDPVAAGWAAAMAAPIGPLDRQRLLEIDGAGARLERLRTMLHAEVEVAGDRLAAGG